MQQKTVLITGATSGIGAAYAKRFAKEGYDLIITGRRKEKIENLAEKIRNENQVAVEVILAELSNEEEIEKVLEHIKNRKIDVLVNNAGFGYNALYQECDINLAERLAKVNVIAPMKLIRAVVPGMIEKKSGTIINISSMSVSMIVAKNAVYSGAKAFLKTFTEALHQDLAGTGIRVIAVMPGLTHTDFHEKIGMSRAKQVDKGFINWMSAEKLVDISLKDLEKGKIISLPGCKNRILLWILGHLSQKKYDQLMQQFQKKRALK